MNRKQANIELENLFKGGFSMMSVRGLITKIYDSLEKQSFDTHQYKETNSHIPCKEGIPVNTSTTPPIITDKTLVTYNPTLMDQILQRSDIDVYDFSTSKIAIYSHEYGKLYYYPKADKVHLTKQNEWKSPGFNWLYKNIKDA